MMTHSTSKYSFYTIALTLLMAPFAITATADQNDDGWQRVDRPAMHEQMEARIQERIDAIDSDGDGQVSADEFQAANRDRFSRFDENGDDAITLDEMQDSAIKRANEKLQKRFARLDVNSDGKVTREEMQQQKRQRMFKRMDRNGDGYLTGDEFRPGAHRGARPGRHPGKGS